MDEARAIPGRRPHATRLADLAARSSWIGGRFQHAPWRAVLLPVALLAALVWTYSATLGPLIHDWRVDDNYSVGGLVPLAAAYILWTDRKRLAAVLVKPSYWGLPIIAAAQLLRAAGLMFVFESAERYSLVLTAGGLVVLVAGWRAFRAVFWVWLFLFLMVPLPGRLHNAIAGPLQSLATEGAVAGLQILGIQVARQGHVMLLNDRVPVAVAEACSGLRMLTAFVVVSAVLALLIRRPAWHKAVLVASSIPIAVVANLIRLIVTAVLFLWTRDFAERFFHDFAGLTMMPLALVIMAGELWLMSHLVVEERSRA
jgi:exosortase